MFGTHVMQYPNSFKVNVPSLDLWKYTSQLYTVSRLDPCLLLSVWSVKPRRSIKDCAIEL